MMFVYMPSFSLKFPLHGSVPGLFLSFLNENTLSQSNVPLAVFNQEHMGVRSKAETLH